MEIPVDYMEPAEPGLHKFTVDAIDESDSEFGPRICLTGKLEDGNPAKVWLPRPASMVSDRTKLARIYTQAGIDWKESEKIDPEADLLGASFEVDVSYTDEGYLRAAVEY